MALPTASDNIWPKLIISEAAAPASPSAGQFKLYVDSADHLLKYKNSAGTVVTLGAGIADQGTATYLDFTTGAAPSSPAAGKVRLYSLTGDHLYQKDSAGAATALDGAGGGGSDLVQVASGAGSVRVPGIAVPDRMPASPSGSDDEFDAFSGWTTLGTLDTSNVTDFKSHWHGKRACSSDINGIYKAVPSMPFTITTKISALYLSGSSHPSVGIMLLDSTPTAIREFSFNFASGTTWGLSLRRYTNRTTFSTSIDVGVPETKLSGLSLANLWLQLLVTSSSSVTFRYSLDGFLFHDISSITAVSPTITPGFMGLCVSDPVSASTPEMVVDYFRVT